MMVDPAGQNPFRVVYVCTGNTCRSPMAEGILRKLVQDLDEETPVIESLSAGTMGLVGSPASHFSVIVAAEYGVDIRNHRSRAATPDLLNSVDLVMALAADHLQYATALGIPTEKVYLVRAFPSHDGDPVALSVPDPIGLPREAYQEAYFQIEEAIRRGLPEIVKRAREKASKA